VFHARARTRLWLVGALAAVVVVLLPGGVAHADPTVAQIEAQIQAAWSEAEPLIEQYNAVHEEYQRNKARQDELLQQLAPLEQQLALGQTRVGAIAAAAYRGARLDTFSALLASGSAKQLANQLALVDVLAHEQNQQLAGALQTKAELDNQKAPIDALVTELAKQDAEVTQQRQGIETKLSELQQLRLQAYGSSGGGRTGRL
jgi:septal ring factor EnvC (AmiA/AmiB activator)